jgi:putative phosphoribosyl transferase
MDPRIEPGISALPYRDREEAGAVLARMLRDQPGLDPIVLALPRGGVPVGDQIARAIGAPLDLMLVRKIGVPFQPELAAGAIASGGVVILNPEVTPFVSAAQLEAVARTELAELERRERLYRGDRAAPELAGRTVILVDDGLATGATMRAAIAAARQAGPAEVVVAVPVAPAETVHSLRGVADRVVCPATPEPFRAIGLWYRDFHQVGDDEVEALLEP